MGDKEMTTQFESEILQKLCEMQEQAIIELIALTGFDISTLNFKKVVGVLSALDAIKLTGYTISKIETDSALECSYILQRHGEYIAQRDVSVKIKVDNKAEEDRTEEINLKKGEIFGATKRKLIVDITGKPFTFCCNKLKEFAKSHYFYLHFQIRDMKKLDPTNPCLILGDAEGNKSWYACCPFCRADIVVKEVKRKNKAEEGEVEEK
jgi:hypothetical protein